MAIYQGKVLNVLGFPVSGEIRVYQRVVQVRTSAAAYSNRGQDMFASAWIRNGEFTLVFVNNSSPVAVAAAGGGASHGGSGTPQAASGTAQAGLRDYLANRPLPGHVEISAGGHTEWHFLDLNCRPFGTPRVTRTARNRQNVFWFRLLT
ncbi:MAG: hypothetical protein LC126_13510 [Bryobacterales bacterium]|nr:hypothetical protein [Bryobacterales bacterium]